MWWVLYSSFISFDSSLKPTTLHSGRKYSYWSTTNSLGRRSACSAAQEPGQSHEWSVWGPRLPCHSLLTPFNLDLKRGWRRNKRQAEARASVGAQEISSPCREHLPSLPSVLERAIKETLPGLTEDALGLGSGCSGCAPLLQSFPQGQASQGIRHQPV